jgi:membrane-anchored glycerophosphoryl diester phosphodiesterase (GDPDase)
MKKFFKELFSDDNTINEKSVVGFIAFLMMVLTLATDVITGVLGQEMPIQEFIFDGFMVIVLGSFGIASVDKWINKSKGGPTED